MLTIGVLGATDWETTARYYQVANELVQERRGGMHSARCLLYSLDFAEIEQLQAAGRWTELGDLLAGAARTLASAGADLLVLCGLQAHVAFARAEAPGIPVVDLGEVLADAAVAAGVDTVGLIGTAFTMEQHFYRRHLGARGVRVIVPPDRARAAVHRVVYELCCGDTRAESGPEVEAVIAELVRAGAQGIVLGCPEVETLITASQCPMPLFPATRLQVEAAVAMALEGRSRS